MFKHLHFRRQAATKTPDERLAEALGQIDQNLRAMVSGKMEPHSAAKAVWATAFTLAAELPNTVMWPLWLMWGGLKDWIEMKPKETPEAERTIRRAATEWLQIDQDDQSRFAYVDRWLYEELGFERPEPNSPRSKTIQ